MQKITPFLWFDGNAEEAARFYTSIFDNSKIVRMSHYGEAGPGPKGEVMVVNFELDGERFMALNGGPEFQFSPAVSLLVNCKNQRRWIATGRGCRKGARRSSVGGSRTSTACPGRSSRRSWARCCRTRTLGWRTGS
jgi:hypothetical protein